MYSGSGRGEVACEQALRGALAAGREKEGHVATTSLEFEYPHRKSRCKMLIGGYDISNDIITLGTFFFNVCLHSRSFLLRADWRKSDSSVGGEPPGNWRWSSNLQAVLPFPVPPPESPRELSRRLVGESWSRIPAPFSRHPTSRTSVISIPCQDLSESRFPSSRSY